MAVDYSPLQKNAMKRLENIASGMKRDDRYQKNEDGGVVREFLKKIKDRDLYDYDLVYPHDLPSDTLSALLRLTDEDARLDAVKALFTLPHAPKPKLGADTVLTMAVSFRAVNTLPFLFEQGFVLTPKQVDKVELDLAKLAMVGPFPHIDLIALNLWCTRRHDFIDEMLRNFGKADCHPLHEVVERLAHLPSEWDKPRLEDVCTALLALARRKHSPEIFAHEDLIQAGVVMCRHGWLRFPDAQALTVPIPVSHPQSLQAFLATVEQRALQDLTPASIALRPSPRL